VQVRILPIHPGFEESRDSICGTNSLERRETGAGSMLRAVTSAADSIQKPGCAQLDSKANVRPACGQMLKG
jgi:hypothetical protein